jgi:type II secretory pathway pseudopilin PulG
MTERSKLPALLTELTLTLLIFSVCAAVCLSVFAVSRKTAKESGELGSAAAWAQSAAEAYRAAKGDMEKAAGLLGAGYEQGVLYLDFDGDWDSRPVNGETVFSLRMTEEDGTAHIEVAAEGGETLFSLDVKAVAYGK